MACASLLSDEDLCRFRTKPCRRSRQGGCDFGAIRCQYSHNVYWPRRCPFYLSDNLSIRYVPLECPDIKICKGDIPQSRCTRGGACPFAHSMEEILYHPLFYKTKICSSFHSGECSAYYCPFIHGLAERREIKNYYLPFTEGLNIPQIPGIIIDNDKTKARNNKMEKEMSASYFDSNWRNLNEKVDKKLIEVNNFGKAYKTTENNTRLQFTRFENPDQNNIFNDSLGEGSETSLVLANATIEREEINEIDDPFTKIKCSKQYENYVSSFQNTSESKDEKRCIESQNLEFEYRNRCSEDLNINEEKEVQDMIFNDFHSERNENINFLNDKKNTLKIKKAKDKKLLTENDEFIESCLFIPDFSVQQEGNLTLTKKYYEKKEKEILNKIKSLILYEFPNSSISNLENLLGSFNLEEIFESNNTPTNINATQPQNNEFSLNNYENADNKQFKGNSNYDVKYKSSLKTGIIAKGDTNKVENLSNNANFFMTNLKQKKSFKEIKGFQQKKKSINTKTQLKEVNDENLISNA